MMKGDSKPYRKSWGYQCYNEKLQMRAPALLPEIGCLSQMALVHLILVFCPTRTPSPHGHSFLGRIANGVWEGQQCPACLPWLQNITVLPLGLRIFPLFYCNYVFLCPDSTYLRVSVGFNSCFSFQNSPVLRQRKTKNGKVFNIHMPLKLHSLDMNK